MEATEYQQLAMRTNDGKAKARLIGSMLGCDMEWLFSQQVVIEQQIDIVGVFNSCLGLSGEVGEFNDMIKKWIFHEKPINFEHAKKEAGDICWYLAMLCESFGWSLDDIMQMNIDKLKARYPEGFDIERANNRNPKDV